MTEITVTATKHVGSIHVELTAGTDGNVQGMVQIVLDAPEPEVTSVIASSMMTVRSIPDTSPEVQAAIETLKAAVLVWDQEDNP